MFQLLMAAVVSLESLLGEMTDRDALARVPETPYVLRLWSSYDRRTVTPDDPKGWFANDDFSHFVRVETNGVRREAVLVDAKGPGAIVRFWQTFARTDRKGVLRLYVDGRKVLEGAASELVGGSALCGSPLSESLSPQASPALRGYNLYLPVPYAESCKVTYESADLWREKSVWKREAYYYNVETRTYPAGTEVESFSALALEKAKERIAAVNALLAQGTSDPLPPSAVSQAFDGVVPPGETRELVVKGQSAVVSLAFAPKLVSRSPYGKPFKPEILDDLVVEMSFDGEKTVAAPCGYFFGTGWNFSPYRSRFLSAAPDGLLTARWTMPFAREAKLALRNVGTDPVRIERSALATAPWRWDARSLRFGLTHREHRRVPTIRNGYPWDAEYAALRGCGRLVGATTSVLNPCLNWWGEGDEKIWIDGEAFPSYVGTGTEDHYGYAWCDGHAFSHPFLAQPCGQGDMSSGFAVNVRMRSLDSIPFAKSLRFDMEVFHHRRTTVDYVTTAFWYLKPESGR